MDTLRNQHHQAVKEEILDCGFVEVDSEDVHQLCTACLCATRTAHALDDVTLKQYYKNILIEAQLEADEYVLQSQRLCWECVAHLKRSVRFREQVQDSCRLIQMVHVCEKEDLDEFLQTSVCQPSRLTTRFAHSIDISPQGGDADDDDDGDKTDDNNPRAARPPPQSYKGKGRGRASEPAKGAGPEPGTSRPQKRMRSDDQASQSGESLPHKRPCISGPYAIVQPDASYAQAARTHNWHRVMVVVPQDGRELTPEQYVLLRLEVEKRHDEAADDLTQDFVPGFDHMPQPLPRGGLKFTCLDQETVSWLQEVTLKLPPLWEGGCQFMAVRWTELPRLVKGVVWLPDSHGTDVEGLRVTLVRANRQRGIDMSRWRLVKVEFKNTNAGLQGAIMVFGIPMADLPKLAKRQMKLCYMCGSVKLEVRRRKWAAVTRSLSG